MVFSRLLALFIATSGVLLKSLAQQPQCVLLLQRTLWQSRVVARRDISWSEEVRFLLRWGEAVLGYRGCSTSSYCSTYSTPTLSRQVAHGVPHCCATALLGDHYVQVCDLACFKVRADTVAQHWLLLHGALGLLHSFFSPDGSTLGVVERAGQRGAIALLSTLLALTDPVSVSRPAMLTASQLLN